jgi:hypothetical protein
MVIDSNRPALMTSDCRTFMGLFGNPLSSLLGSSLLETIVSNQCWGLEEAATNLPVICQ